MTAAQLCPYIVRLLHAPVRVYNPEGTLTKLYVDNGEQEDVLERDPAFRKQLLEKGRENHPLLHLEANQVIYGIVRGVSETYLLYERHPKEYDTVGILCGSGRRYSKRRRRKSVSCDMGSLLLLDKVSVAEYNKM